MTDNVNHPTHYADGWSRGAEVIDITENLNFNRGNAVKYIARAGKKSAILEVEDLQKAAWYLSREIERLTDRSQAEPSYNVVDWDEFWSDIDVSITEAGTYRSLPRVWESLCEVPHSVVVQDQKGHHWDFYIKNWGFGTPGEIRRYPVDMAAYGVQAWDHLGPFTEVLS